MIRRDPISRSLVVRGSRAADYDSGSGPDLTADRRVDRLVGRLSAVLRPAAVPVCVRTSAKVVGLTFDDGPDPRVTPHVLDALACSSARATFFVLVEAAERHPHLVRRMLLEGHEVGLHGIDHTRLADLPARTVGRRLSQGRRRLEAVAGCPVRLFRPAYGALRLSGLLAARAAGLEVVLWSAWARDWQEDGASAVAARASRAIHPGGILLLHDATADADLPAPSFDRGEVVRTVLADLAERSYRVVPAGDLLASGPGVHAILLARRTGGLALRAHRLAAGRSLS